MDVVQNIHEKCQVRIILFVSSLKLHRTKFESHDNTHESLLFLGNSWAYSSKPCSLLHVGSSVLLIEWLAPFTIEQRWWLSSSISSISRSSESHSLLGKSSLLSRKKYHWSCLWLQKSNPKKISSSAIVRVRHCHQKTTAINSINNNANANVNDNSNKDEDEERTEWQQQRWWENNLIINNHTTIKHKTYVQYVLNFSWKIHNLKTSLTYFMHFSCKESVWEYSVLLFKHTSSYFSHTISVQSMWI